MNNHNPFNFMFLRLDKSFDLWDTLKIRICLYVSLEIFKLIVVR